MKKPRQNNFTILAYVTYLQDRKTVPISVYTGHMLFKNILKNPLVRRCTNGIDIRIPNRLFLSYYSTVNKWDFYYSTDNKCLHWIERQKSVLKLKGELFWSWKNTSMDAEEPYRIKTSPNLSESPYRLQIMFISNTILQYIPITREWQTKETILCKFPFHFSMFFNGQIVSTDIIWLSVGIFAGNTRANAALLSLLRLFHKGACVQTIVPLQILAPSDLIFKKKICYLLVRKVYTTSNFRAWKLSWTDNFESSPWSSGNKVIRRYFF